ncbi:MAG: class I SAM-dependent rRNA methyltransferase [Fibrobacter sp.]|nr:class I SAM-dependent rRNA methyltransferase [Fibrobacter sp.]
MIKIYLKKGKEKPVVMGHPWIFNGAIANVTGEGKPGQLCRVYSAQNEFLGVGYYNPVSAISVRMFSVKEETFTAEFLEQRILSAIELRKLSISNDTDSYRLINSEGDFIPGLIVDVYAGGLVVQILTAGIENLKDQIIGLLQKVMNPTFIYERSDTEARTREGLEDSNGLIVGTVPESMTLREQNLKFKADVAGGQKTGFFFDQRQNREILKSYAYSRVMCDCFCYSGAFSVYALAGGAKHVDAVDISKPALGWARENVLLNNFDSSKIDFTNADIFKYLRETESRYDLIVLDPPKFARHAGEVDRAARGYKDINLLGFKKIEVGGILFTFSCSNAIEPRLFRQIVFAAAADAHRKIQLLHVLSAGPDHPVNIAHREGEYLKGLVLRVLE